MKHRLYLLFFSILPALSLYAQVGIGTVSPNSMLDLRGSFAPIFRSFSGSTSLTMTDCTVLFTGASASTVTLPDASTCAGRIYCIKNFSTFLPTPVLSIGTTASQLIDGGVAWLLSQTNGAVTVISDGANWEVFGQSLPSALGSYWNLGGNSVTGTTALGTITGFDLPFITNNTEKMRITSAGNVGIGSATFSINPEALLVYQNSSTSFNVIGGKGNLNNYLQLNIQNQNSGNNASSDVVATADNGNESSNYVDLGMNSSTYSTGTIMGGADNAYLYSSANDFMIGNSIAAKNMIFFTGGTATSNEAMRITGTGRVGIGTTNPGYTLQVNATANPLYLAGVQTGLSTDSILTIVNGVVRKLQPGALVTSSSNAWSLVGNTGTSPGSNFLGTVDAQAFILKENNTQVGLFGPNSIALGLGASTANSTNSYALGSGASIGYNHLSAFAIGTNSGVSNDSSFAIGVAAATSGQNAFSMGSGSQANSINSFAIGRNAYVGYSFTDGIAIGTNAFSSAANSISIGSNSTAAGKTQANAAGSIAMGNAAVANSANSVVIGPGATTGYSLTNPIALGSGTLVNGSNSLAVGNGANISYVSNATAIGAAASVSGSGSNSTAVGYNASATMTNEVILGDRGNAALSVGIGTESFSGTNREKLLVDAGVTSSVNAIVGRGTNTSYMQLNIQNLSNGNGASSDVVATADNGNETSNFYFDAVNYRLSVAAGTTPASTLQVGGSLGMAITTKTSTYSASGSDYTILCNNTSGGIAVNLPTAVGIMGRIYVIKKISAPGNNVTIAGYGGTETIDGSVTNVIVTQYSSVIIQSDGSGWDILSKF